MTEHFDVVVVGSGFGGSVMAYRLAEAGRSVLVLERGKAYPPGAFPRSPRGMHGNFWDPGAGLHGMFDIWSFRGLEAVVSSGLGGGSLIYANVLLRKDERWFVTDGAHGGAHTPWPVTRADLDPHYDAVERMLGPQPYPFAHAPYDRTPKTRAMVEAAAGIGRTAVQPPLGVTFANPGQAPVPGVPIEGAIPSLHGRTRLTCRLCGECDIGCNDGAKNTLDHTYLSAATLEGATIRTRCEVRRFAPSGDGFHVGYVEHAPDREGVRTATRDLPVVTVTCKRLVLAAGTLGSTYLMLGNRAAFGGGFGAALGTRFCGNGDLLTSIRDTGRNGGGPRHLDPSVGPVITSAIRFPDELDGDATGRGFYIEDGGFPAFMQWAIETGAPTAALRRFARFAILRLCTRLTRSARTGISSQIADLIGDGRRSSAMLTLLGMGRDIPDGRMSRDGNWLDIDWTVKSSRAYFDRMRDEMAGLAGELGGELSDPLRLLKRVITVHPLGGCPMGRTREDGVVDEYGRTFDDPRLVIADGSVMPGPVGANPALTIAAIADRSAGALVESLEGGAPR